MHKQCHGQLIDLWFHPGESFSFQNNAFKATGTTNEDQTLDFHRANRASVVE
jgi:hypothetical protein